MMNIVFVSGLMSDETLWEHQVAHLKDIASITCVSCTQNTPEKMVNAILQKAPNNFVLVGHSMGGWLALEVMRKAKKRVQKLCLINTTARSDSIEKAAKRKAMIEQAKAGKFNQVVEQMLPYFVHNQKAKQRVLGMFLKVGKDAFIAQELAMLMRDESESILASIDCPTLIIHANNDQIFSKEEHTELATKIPHATLVTIQDSGHMSPMEQPEAITSLLRNWLKIQLVKD